MTKLYYIKTSGFDLVASVDEDDTTKFMFPNKFLPFEEEEKSAIDFLNSVEDNSSWEFADYEQFFVDLAWEIVYKKAIIVAQIEKEL